jgi:hypothetical protein
VKVTDINGVETVTLFYKAGTAAFASIGMTPGTAANMYTCVIPGQAADVTVNYYIKADNKTGQVAYHPAGAPVQRQHTPSALPDRDERDL